MIVTSRAQLHPKIKLICEQLCLSFPFWDSVCKKANHKDLLDKNVTSGAKLLSEKGKIKFTTL